MGSTKCPAPEPLNATIQRGVALISAGLDEGSMAYKNIREVMAAQIDLATVLGQFDPKLVKMAPQGEWPED